MSSSIEKNSRADATTAEDVSYADLYKMCEEFFGTGRPSGSSHAIFKTPRQGDPRINIQDDKGKAKAYQVRQVLAALDKLKGLGK